MTWPLVSDKPVKKKEIDTPSGVQQTAAWVPEQSPWRDQLIDQRTAEAAHLRRQIPSAEALFDVAREGIAMQASQQNQLMVADAARRGLLHSGILRAQKQAMARQTTGMLQGAYSQSQQAPDKMRAAILESLATGAPLPEVITEIPQGGMMPFLFGLGGAIVGGAAGGPGGAVAGYQLGSGVGQTAQAVQGPRYRSYGGGGSNWEG